MDDAYYAQKALERARRAEERARQREADEKFLAAFDKRQADRRAHREARDESLAKVESEARIRQSTRVYSNVSTAEDPSVAAERARKVREEEAERQRVREEAKLRREQERAEAEAKAQAAAAAEERERKEREAERQRAREEADRAAEAQRQADEKRRQEAREAKLQAQREEQARLDEERRAAAAKREADRLAKEKAEEEERVAEKARQQARQEEERRVAEEKREADRIAKEEAKNAEDERIAEKARLAEEKREADRIAKEEAEKAEEEARKVREAERAAAAAAEAERAAEAQAEADRKAKDEEDARKAEEEAKNAREEEARRAEEARQEEERLAAEKKKEDETRAAELAAIKQKEDEEEAERLRLEEEEAILKADEERLAAEEAKEKLDINDEVDSLDEEEAALRAEEEAMRLEEEQLRREEEEENARLLAEEEEIARMEAEEAAEAKKAEDERIAAEAKAEEDRLLAEENDRIAAEKKAEEDRIAAEKKAEEERIAAEKKVEEDRIAAEAQKKAEEDRIAAEKKAEEDRIAAEAEKKAEEDRISAEKKAEEDRIAAEKKAEEERIAAEKKAEDDRIAAEKKAEEERIAAEKKAEEDRIAAEKKAEEDRIAAEKKAEEERIAAEKKAEDDRIAAEKKAEEDRIAAEAQKKVAPEPAAEAPTTAASKKAAFLAALNNKIGLGGPPPKAKPAAVAEEPTPTEASPAISSVTSASTTESDASAGVDLLGDSSAAPRLAPLTHARAKGPNRTHRATLAGIRSRMEADGTQSFFVGDVQATPHVDGQVTREGEDAATPATASTATEEAQPAQRKLPPGAMAMPGMSMGGLMGAIKKSAERRASISAPSVSAAAETKLPPVRLIHVRGKGKELFVRLVEPKLSAMSHDSAFILEDVKGSILYVWSGYNANKMQTTKCLDLATRINRGEHAGRAQTHTLRAGEETDAFWALLGATPAPALAKTIPQTNTLPIVVDTLYRLDPTDDGFVLVELASETKNLERGLLWSDACYILDSGYEVRAWIGKSSPKEMREAVYNQGNELLSKPMKNGDARPIWSQIVYKEADRGETVLFTDKFASWPAEYKPKLAAAPPSRARAASAAAEAVSKQTNGATPSASPAKSNGSPAAKPTNSRMAPYDGATMAAIERPASADKVLPDEGIHGSFTAWIQDGFEKKPYPKSRIGIYDDAHCYISMYSWGLTGSERHMVYFWQGQATTPNDQGSAAGLAREVNERICKGSGQLVRVPEFHENEHFLLCHANQKQPYVSLGASLNGSFDGKVVRFIHVRGHSANNAKAHQVQVDASSLNTNDVFIAILDVGKTAPLDAESPYISDAKEVFIWQGRESNEFLRQYAKDTAARLVGPNVNVQTTDEGSENARFWSILGQQSSAKPSYITGRQDNYDLKIYMCTANSQEGFKIGRIWDYSNFDICSDRVLIVEDSTHHIYVWLGSRTAEPERKLALESSLSYAQTVSSPAPVVYMYEGHETLQFKALFHGWVPKQPLDTKSVPGNGEVEKLLPLYQATFSLAQLKDRASLPPTVDQANLEYHLNEEDFTAALKMTRDAFFALPEWKRLEAKKTSPIF